MTLISVPQSFSTRKAICVACLATLSVFGTGWAGLFLAKTATSKLPMKHTVQHKVDVVVPGSSSSSMVDMGVQASTIMGSAKDVEVTIDHLHKQNANSWFGSMETLDGKYGGCSDIFLIPKDDRNIVKCSADTGLKCDDVVRLMKREELDDQNKTSKLYMLKAPEWYVRLNAMRYGLEDEKDVFVIFDEDVNAGYWPKAWSKPGVTTEWVRPKSWSKKEEHGVQFNSVEKQCPPPTSKSICLQSQSVKSLPVLNYVLCPWYKPESKTKTDDKSAGIELACMYAGISWFC